MNADNLERANVLQAAHRILQLELKQWQMLEQPPPIMVDPRTMLLGTAPSGQTAVPMELWVPFKNGMVRHLTRLIELNRKALEEL